MLFLDNTYFDGNSYLPAVSRDAAVGVAHFTQSVGQANLDWFIVNYEPEFMEMLLGKNLYEAFVEGMSADTPLDKWIRLKEKIFVQTPYNGQTFKYSPAAEYVLCKFLNRNNTQTSSKGQVKANVYETVNTDITLIQPQIWNHMSDQCLKIQQFICESGLYDDVALHQDVENNMRARRCPVGIIGYKASFKIWSRFCFRRFQRINDLNI